jgi:hypothetical protein
MKTNINTDYWGNGLIWLPFGKAGTVKASDTGSPAYQVSIDDILAEGSISTLDGIPVYVGHPPEVLATNERKSVGVCLGEWRKSTDGLGGEVLAKITDKATLAEIASGQLSETSPTYVVHEGKRLYNHIGLFQEGKARGANMTIQVEGFTEYKDHDTPVPRDGILEVYHLDPSALLTEQLTNYQVQIMPEQNSQILEMLGTLAARVETLFDAVKPVESELVPAESGIELAFAEGMAAGEVLASAKSHGYVANTELPAIANVTEAKKYVVGKAFASLKTEGYSDQSLTGAYNAAVAHLAATKATVPSVMPVAEAPTVILSEGNTLEQIKRLPIK